MLLELLAILRQEDQPPSQADLCARLGTTPDMLQSMIDILVRKGKLQPDQTPTCGGGTSCSQKSCPGPDDCALVLLKPVRQVRIIPGEES
jgi:hypothetical protein